MTPAITLSQALTDPALFGKTFASPSFWTWRTVAKLIDGLPLSEPREIELFEQCTGRKYNRQARRTVRRLILLAGRRAGKDRFLSAVAVWRAALCTNWREHVSAGEGAVTILLGADKKQAAILRGYCQGLLQAPLLRAEVTRSTGELTEFRNGASLEITTNDARLVRGRSAIAVLGSECCHWRTDEHSASSDEEVVGAAEPSMAMCPDGGLLMLGSSIYRRRGYMYRKFKQLHGNDDSDDICWFAASAVMNPRLPPHVVERALAEDAPRARAEYLNVWREDLSDFVPIDVVEGCTDFGTFSLCECTIRSSATPPFAIPRAAPVPIPSRSPSATACMTRQTPSSSMRCASASRASCLRRSSPSTRNCCGNSISPRFKVIGLPAGSMPTSGSDMASPSCPANAQHPKTTCTRCRCCWLAGCA